MLFCKSNEKALHRAWDLKNMAKKLDSFLYVCLYVALYSASRAIGGALFPLLDTIKLFFGGERSFTYLVNYFFECLKYGNVNTYVENIIAMLLTLLLVWLVFLIRRRRVGSVIYGKRLYFREVAAAILIAFGLQAISALVMKIPFPSAVFNSYESHMSYGSYQSLPLSILISGIIAPLFEEIFFRGVIYDEFKKSGSFFYANFLQSIIFGVLHLNVIQGFYAFFVGFALGGVLKMSKSIYLCMIIHIIFNISNILFGGYISVVSAMPYFIVCGIVALVLGYLLLVKKR